MNHYHGYLFLAKANNIFYFNHGLKARAIYKSTVLAGVSTDQ